MLPGEIKREVAAFRGLRAALIAAGFAALPADRLARQRVERARTHLRQAANRGGVITDATFAEARRIVDPACAVPEISAGIL